MKAIIKTTPNTAIEVFGAREFVKASKAANTQRAYRAAWQEFVAFCERRGLSALPADPQTIVKFVVYLSKTVKPQTIAVKLAGLSFAHRTAKQADPTNDESVAVVMAGVRRKLGIAPVKKSAITRDELLAMIATLDTDTLARKRDAALLLVGFCGAFRRSELTALNVADIRLNGHMTITVKRGKTDQTGEGLVKHFEDDGDIAPVAALQSWLDAAGIKSGAIFRQIDRWGNVRDSRLTGQSVALVVKSAAEAAGLDWRSMSGHSLRAGFVTAAYIGGARDLDIMQQTGHKDTRTLKEYYRATGQGALSALRAATKTK
jgi:site-specific recombinase XerD